jgi:hypothetical protein
MTGMTEYIYDATGAPTDRSSSVGWSEGRRVAEGGISAWSCDTATNGLARSKLLIEDGQHHLRLHLIESLQG